MIKNLLWSHQNDAIRMLSQYTKDYRNSITKQSALVQMPTGSGKSGIIAYLARCCSNSGLTVILTPRISLRDQLFNDVSFRFFSHIGFPTDNLENEVIKISKSVLIQPEYISDNYVLVMTIQMLVNIEKTAPQLFELLSSKVQQLIIDEGHYEPAKNWSKSIRKIATPKIIFTATPFRNDLKNFNIDKNYCFTYSLAQAQKENYLRKVEFVNRSISCLKTPNDFVNDLLDFYEKTFSETPEKPRVIIRCDDSSSIKHLANELRSRHKTVVGIHETFSNRDWERKEVPNCETEDAIFWIHQFKLLEGIDDYRFQVLAIYEKISNARSLVQQIGRIIRNPKKKTNQVGYVLEHWSDYHKTLWDGFLHYDSLVDEIGINAYELASVEMITKKSLSIQPQIMYGNGRFRSRLNFDEIDPRNDIQFPLRTNILEKLPNFSLDVFAQNTVEEFIDNDYCFHCYRIENNIWLALFINEKNSEFLLNHSFVELRLNVLLACEFQKYVCIYDSSKTNYIGNDKNGIGNPIDVKTLKKLFAQKKSTKLTSVSLNNSNLGTSSIRSRSITAASIEATTPFFDDYAQICTIAEGYVSDEASSFLFSKATRRYVGFSSGRIVQNSNVPLLQYLDWLNRVKQVLEKNTRTTNTLTRYALEHTVPNKPDPKNILLDSYELEEHYSLCENSSISLNFDDACSEVIEGKFSLKANGSIVDATIDYSNGKYIITCDDLKNLYFNNTENFPPNVVKYINDTQAFRVLPEDYSSVYIRGQFYKPEFKIGKLFDIENYNLKNCFVTDSKIGDCSTEKGKSSFYEQESKRWDPNSLFGIISDLGKTTTIFGHFGNPDIIICDDVGTEIADFIYCDTKANKVVFIHAKATTEKNKCSASKLHDVCAQATKNLAYLAMFNDHQPSKLNSWNKEWKAKVSGGSGKVEKRILKPDSGTPKSLWKKIRNCINNPMAEKEVWLMLGNIISQQYFEDSLSKSKPKPNVIQAAYLLHATMSDVASVGGKLKIFCSP